MEEKSKYASQTIDSPSMLKRYSHNIRFSVGKKLLNIGKEDIFLDYGGAEGAFSQTLINLSPKEIMIYEPPGDMTEGLKKNCAYVRERFDINYTMESDISKIKDNYFNKIALFEVLEHLSENLTKEALQNIHRVITDDGVLVVSVPVEIGPAGLAKNLFRFFKGEDHDDITLRNIARAFFGLPIYRGEYDYVNSHVGFNFYITKKILENEGYKITKTTYSPFKIMGCLINSQAFFVCKKILR